MNINQPQKIMPQKSNQPLIFLLVLLFFSVSVSALYLFYQNRGLKKQIIRPPQTQISPVIETSPTLDPTSDQFLDKPSPTP